MKPLEEPLRQTSDHHHHRSPKPWNVDHVPAVLNRAVNTAPYPASTGKKRTLLECCRHRGVDKAGLDCHHCHPAGMQPITQSLEKSLDAAFGSSIDVVALSSAVSGYRRYDRNAAAMLRLKVIGENRQQCDSRREVDVEGIDSIGDLLFSR